MKKLYKKSRNVSVMYFWQCNGNCPCPCGGGQSAAAQVNTIAGGYM